MKALGRDVGVPRWVRGLVGTSVALVLWEIVVRGGAVDATTIPPAGLTLQRTAELLTDYSFLQDVVFTLRSYAIGLAVAVVVGIASGAALGVSRRLARMTSAIVELLRPIPAVALIPLGILLFGRGTSLSVALVLWACVWPVLFNTMYGVQASDPIAKDTARSFGLGSWSILRRVTFPSAVPYIATGVRVASAVAIIVTVSAELIAGGGRGLGTWILRVSASGTNLDLVFAGTLVAGLLGFGTNVVFVWVEQRIAGWHFQRIAQQGGS